MTFYEEIVLRTQGNYSRFRGMYARGEAAVELSRKAPVPFDEQVRIAAEKVREADCVVVGGASGLSAAGGGDFYYEDNASYRKYFGKYAEKYGFKGAFAGTTAHWDSRAEFWGYLATFLHTTQTAPLRKPYADLNAILKGKDIFVLTTNQDTQFLRLYPEEMVAQIQGDHRFFQCARCCTDEVWDAVAPVEEMVRAMGAATAVPEDMIPRCPHCGGEAFPWVRGYGNFLEGERYEEQYARVSDYILKNRDRKLLFLELGVGRMTPMFIQEPFWMLTKSLPQAFYISVNDRFALLPKDIEDRGMAVRADIAVLLEEVRRLM